jgi:hypothetical protein
MLYLSIAIRLFGFYMGYFALARLPEWFYYIKASSDGVTDELDGFSFAFAFVMIVIAFLTSIVLVLFPVTVAKWLAPFKNADSFNVAVSSHNIEAVLFSVIGIYIFSWAIPDLAYNFLQYSAEVSVRYESPQLWQIKAQIAVTFIELAIASYLLFGSLKLQKFVRKFSTQKL